MRDVKFEIMFWIHNSDFTKRIEKHYTTIERLTTSKDKFNYSDVDVIARRQYTGEKDNAGVEVYEGDIITALDGYFVVKFEDGMFLADTVNASCDDAYELGGLSFHVIGNIYENPELIRGTTNDRN